MPIERTNPPGLYPNPGYTHVVKAGNTVHIAGQVARDASGNLVGVGDFEAQACQVFENIKIGLASVGATFDHVVHMNMYLTRAEDYDAYKRVRSKYVTGGHAGVWMVITRLARPEMLIEVEATAVLD